MLLTLLMLWTQLILVALMLLLFVARVILPLLPLMMTKQSSSLPALLISLLLSLLKQVR